LEDTPYQGEAVIPKLLHLYVLSRYRANSDV